MVQVVHHEWPSGAWFTFNCYHHWTTLVIRVGEGTGHLIYGKEGVTQVDPLVMVGYGLGPPPPPHPVTTDGPPQSHTALVCG